MKLFTTLIVSLAAFTFSLMADHHNKPAKSSAALEKMKSLAGVWIGHADMGEGPIDFTVEYRLIAGGSVVEERTFAGTPKEMVTMYHDKNGKLALTHYCMLQNQPAMIAKKSGSEFIHFDFDPSCGINAKKEMHMHSLKLTFNEDGTVTQSWTLFDEGKAQGPHPMVLKRKKS